MDDKTTRIAWLGVAGTLIAMVFVLVFFRDQYSATMYSEHVFHPDGTCTVDTWRGEGEMRERTLKSRPVMCNEWNPDPHASRVLPLHTD